MKIERLLFFDNVRTDETISLGIRIYNAVMHSREDHVNPTVLEGYYELQRRLLRNQDEGAGTGSYWENYVYKKVAESENRFSLAAEQGRQDTAIRQLAAGDAADLRELVSGNWEEVVRRIADGRPSVCTTPYAGPVSERLQSVAEALQEAEAEGVTAALENHYHKYCCGILGKYRAFTWEGRLKGVEHPDPITFEDLVGYERQKEQLIRNTTAFLRGKRANNVLLYGDKGTGKSSSVKALLNRFAPDGLRLISIQKDKIFDVSAIMDSVANRGGRFIIFIDDLSFEETEIEYKRFKSILEGGVELQPENVLIYVTSNRRNLVKEMWGDRGENGEVHVNDGIQERLSLADRFGLTITFGAPDKKLYNEIVKAIAKREGLQMDEEQLLAEANIWDLRQTSRSGRSARQFITHLAGEER
ncbi:MAG: ATP-binding protein [Firmicutes bacterium]|nr:ATP-binding protein [Bacillota bacterium]